MTTDTTTLPGEHGAASRRREAFLPVSLLFLLAVLFGARQLASWPARLRYPGEMTSIEGMRLAEMLHHAEGVPIYAPPSSRGFDAAVYGPLYYLVGARLVDRHKPTYFPLRLVSMLGTLGCAAGCGLLAFWLARSYLAAVLALFLFLSYGVVARFGTSARCDSVAILLLFVGFLVSYRLQHSSALLLAVPFMLAGFFYRQQCVAASLAVLLFLLFGKRYRLACQFALLMALGAVSLLALFHFVVFPGQAFLSHFFSYNLLLPSWSDSARGWGFFAFVVVLPLLAGVRFLRQYPDRLLAFYLGCTVLLSLVMVGKEGSDCNYFLESILVLSSLLAASVARAIGEPLRAAQLSLLLGVALLLGHGFGGPVPSARDLAQDHALQDFLRRTFAPGTRALGYFVGDLVRAGLEVPVSDPYQYARLVRKGTLSDRNLVLQLQERHYGVVMLNFDLLARRGREAESLYLTESAQRAILANYRLAAIQEMPRPERFREDDRFYVWVPCPDPEAISPAALPHREAR